MKRGACVAYKPPTFSEWQAIKRLQERTKPFLSEFKAKFQELESKVKSNALYPYFVAIAQEKGLGRFEAFVLFQYFRFKPEVLKGERYKLQREYLMKSGENVEESLKWLNAYRLAAYRASHR